MSNKASQNQIEFISSHKQYISNKMLYENYLENPNYINAKLLIKDIIECMAVLEEGELYD